MTDYVTLGEALTTKDDQIKRCGGSPGVRDLGLLEAALSRPQTGYCSDLIEEAAALWERLSQNQPFIDGNERTAFAVTDTFLVINGRRITADATAAHTFIAALYESGDLNFPTLVPWLRENVGLI